MMESDPVRDPRLEDLVALMKQTARLRTELADSERSAREQVKGFLRELLEVLDACEAYAASMAPHEAEADELARTWLGYFRRAQRKLERALERFGVTRIEALEGKALPGYHFIEETRAEPGCEEDSILEERKRGYQWRGEVLRTAVVVTVRNA